MSEYMFGVGRGFLPEVANEIAERHGAVAINYTDPGCGCGEGHGDGCPAHRRHWFATPDLGTPFREAVAEAVLADCEAAGIFEPASDEE